MGRVEGAPAQGRRHSPPTVVESSDAGAPFEDDPETGRVATLHIGTQVIESCGQLVLKPLKASRTREVQKVLPAHGLTEGDEGFRPALQPEAVFDGERQDGAIGCPLDEARHAGLEAERTLPHVAEAALRGDPERPVAGGEYLRTHLEKVRCAAPTFEIDAEGPDAAEDAVLLQH